MRVLVAGAGAVGSWLGGKLHASGTPVTLVARGDHGAAMAADGLRLEGRRRVHTHPPVVPSIQAAIAEGPFDVVLVTVKSYDTAGVAAELAAAGAPPRAVCFQNGVGNEEVLKAALPGTAIIPATLTTAVHLSAPGTVTAWHKGGIGLAPSSEGAPVTDLAAAFRTAGLATRCYDDGPSLKWSKLLLNLLGTACSAVLEWPPSRVLRDRRLFEVERAAWLEALAVMRAMGLQVVPLPGYRVDWMAHLARLPPFLLQPFVHRGVARERGQRLPSVALDLARGRRTEVEVLNGAVARHASLVGVAAPVNRALNNLIGDLSAGHLDRRRYVGRPDRLLASLEQEVRAATIARKGGAGQATSDGHGGAQADGRQAKSRTPTPRAGRRPRPNKRG